MKFKLLAVVVLLLPMVAQTQSGPKISKSQAERAALAQVKGGRVISAEYELDGGKHVWSLDVKTPDGIREVWVDPISGMVIKNDAESAAKERRENSGVQKWKMISKAKAEEIALRAVPRGKVLEAELETESGVRIWSLDVKWGKEIKEVWINPVSGKVMKVTQETARQEEREKAAGMTGKKNIK